MAPIKVLLKLLFYGNTELKINEPTQGVSILAKTISCTTFFEVLGK